MLINIFKHCKIFIAKNITLTLVIELIRGLPQKDREVQILSADIFRIKFI